MTQEDKTLLLKDLCARLPYGVKMIDTEPYSAEHNPILTLSYISEDNGIGCRAGKGFMSTSLGSIKPYLLPLSSMTDKDLIEFLQIKGMNLNSDKLKTFRRGISVIVSTLPSYSRHIDWLNKNHFDYRGLIEKGLAVDATGLDIY